jgi:hypothetical protein
MSRLVTGPGFWMQESVGSRIVGTCSSAQISAFRVPSAPTFGGIVEVAGMTALGESCRRRGHAGSFVHDPHLPPPGGATRSSFDSTA